MWQKFTSVEKEKQSISNFLSMHGKARELLLELEIDQLNHANGVDKVLENLDTLYLKDKLQSAYQMCDNFEKFKRPTDMTIAEFVVEFGRLYNKAKAHEMVLPDGLLAYKLLNNANISNYHEKLICATMTTLPNEVMKEQLEDLWRLEYICSIK